MDDDDDSLSGESADDDGKSPANGYDETEGTLDTLSTLGSQAVLEQLPELADILVGDGFIALEVEQRDSKKKKIKQNINI